MNKSNDAQTAKLCFWCNTDRYESALRHEGPHSTVCFHFREEQRGGTDENRNKASELGYVE